MNRHLPFAALMALSLIAGALTFPHYGESWDVNGLSKYASSTFSLYQGLAGEGDVSPDSIQDELALGNYGPAYMVLLEGVDSLSTDQLEDGSGPIQHLLSFLTFQLGVAALYMLALRWMSPVAAFGTVLLFAAQPVLWGHAFINPKDIPFMSFFLLTLVGGFRLADRLQPVPMDRRTLLILAVFWLLPFGLIFIGSDAILKWIDALVRSAAAGGTNIFSFTASHITTAAPELYVQRYSKLFIQFAFLYLLLSIPVVLLYLRRTNRGVASELVALVAAGVLLGLAISIRSVGMFAGVLVAAFALRQHRTKALMHLSLYVAIAAAALYVLWPYLWVDPAGRLVESIQTMSRYPWTGSVRFGGVDQPAVNLPPSYLPVMLGIQLTEPVWPLFAAGLVTALISLRQHRELILLVSLWFALPLLGLIAIRAVLYDNFRQVLFLLPPIFLLGGLAIEKVRWPAVQWTGIFLMALPGILGILKLHPYEYVYYNNIVGGVDGANRNYEMDYWGTSYREAALWLNTAAPPNARIWAEGPAHLLGKYLREDLKLYSSYESERAEDYHFIVALNRYDLDLTAFPQANVVHTIERQGAVLAVIKEP